MTSPAATGPLSAASAAPQRPLSGSLRGADPAAGPARVVCCPHSGGSATHYRPWQRVAPDGVAVLAMQYPGRHERMAEPFAADVHELADALAADVAAELAVRPGPVVVFGHSMGSSVAFETARRLSAAGLPPAGLIVSAHTAPAVPIESDLHRLPDDEMWAALAAMGGTEPEILQMTELRELYSPVLRCDLGISTNYLDPDCAGALDVPVLALAGDDDPIARPDDMLRWAEVTTGRFEQHTLPGDHFYLDAHVPQILRLAQELLSRA